MKADELSGVDCINEIRVPVYAGVVWRAQLTGVIKVRVVLNQAGAVSRISVTGGHAALNGWVTASMGTASFRPACGGRTVEVTFKYIIEGEKREAPDNRVTLKYPATFEITAHPAILHPTID